MIYTITATYRSPEDRREETRCFGYYIDLADAINAVEQNKCDMHECLYNFIVIEKIGEGIHAMATDIKWYAWNDDKYSWEYTPKPDWSIGICNYSIG